MTRVALPPRTCVLSQHEYPVLRAEGYGFVDDEWLERHHRDDVVLHYLCEGGALSFAYVPSGTPPSPEWRAHAVRARVAATGTLTLGIRAFLAGMPASALPQIVLELDEGRLVTPLADVVRMAARWHEARDAIARQALREATRMTRDAHRQQQRQRHGAELRPQCAALLAAHPGAVGTWFAAQCPLCGARGNVRRCDGDLVLCRACYTAW